jgi:serine/threonine protein kinase
MRGGKLIGQGSYGCAFHPGFKCSARESGGDLKKIKRRVSKVQENDFFSKNEIKIGKRVQDIADYAQYFAPVLDACPVTIEQLEESDRDIGKCRAIESSDDLVIMNSQYIRGKTPYYWLEERVNLSVLSTEEKKIASIKEWCALLMTAIGKLERAKIVHHDIKQNNIIVRPSGRPVLLDFGYSIDVEMLDAYAHGDKNITIEKIRENYSELIIYGPDYEFWSPDLQICGKLLEGGEITENVVREISNMFVEHVLEPFGTFDQEFIRRYREMLELDLTQYVGMSREDALRTAVKSWKHWDVHCIAVMMIQLLSVMMESNILDISDDAVHKNIERIMEWALWGIHPVEKINVNEWRKKWRKLVE